jgi:hypothetical protein
MQSMRLGKLAQAMLALALTGDPAQGQGVAPGGPIGGSTAIGSGIGPGSAPGGTGPSYPNGTGNAALAPAPPIPPGGYPPLGRAETGPGGQKVSGPTTGAQDKSGSGPSSKVPALPSRYLQPRDPFDPTTPKNTNP